MKNILNKIRRWISTLFNRNKALKDIVRTQIDDNHYKLIEKWKAIYSGFYDEWHDVKYYTIDGQRKRRMHTLNMAKVACAELAKIIFTEKVDINISDEAYNENVKNVLDRNGFFKTFQNKLEQNFALGGLVLKGHVDDRIKISYVTPDCFIPMTYDESEISEGVFLNITRSGDKIYCLYEFHEWRMVTLENGEVSKVYVIKNELYESASDSTDAKKVPLATLYDDLEEEVTIEGLTQPLFVYIRPNISNNFDLQSPLGVSIFANALDTLYAIDVAFDSFIREFRLGRRRIIVPATAIQTIVDPKTGTMHRYFDATDEVYQAMNLGDPEKQKIHDNTVSIRAEEHIRAINALLNMFAIQIGFSPGTFTFDGQSLKTATEVISEKSQTFQTKQSNENLIDAALKRFVNIIGELAELYDLFEKPEEYDIEFYWDDSIIKDRESDADYYIKLNMNSLISKKYAIMKILDVTEEQAIEMIEQINEENKSSMPDLSTILGDVE